MRKSRIKRGALFASVFALALNSGYWQRVAFAQEEEIIDVTVSGTPVPFEPYRLSDFINDKTGKPYEPNDLVIIELTGGTKVERLATDVMALVNEVGAHYASLGHQLKDRDFKSLLEKAKDGDLLDEQYLNSVKLRASVLKSQIKEALKDCSLLKLEHLGVNVQTKLPYQLADKIRVPEGALVTANEFLNRMNEQQLGIPSWKTSNLLPSEGSKPPSESETTCSNVSAFHPMILFLIFKI
jgi:hypothetical protein